MWREKFKVQLQVFRQDRTFLWSLILSFTSLILTFILLINVWSGLPTVVPLFYSLPWGEEQLVPLPALLIFLAGTSLLYLFNCSLAIFLHSFSLLYSRILLVVATVVCLLTTITITNIILLML